jgi:hypothetical protein
MEKNRMTLKNKILGRVVTAYLGIVLGGAILGSYLVDNFNYSKKMNGGVIVKVEVRREKEKFVPEKITLASGSSFLIGRDSDNNGSLDKIVLNLKSKDAVESLLPLAKEERLTQIYNEIVESQDYLETIKRRQNLGNPLIGYSLFLGIIGLLASSGYKYSNVKSEQLNHPFFYCR